MNKNVEKYIVQSESILSALTKERGGRIDKEYKGYISSLGASIRMAGLLATLAFFSRDKENSNSTQDRSVVVTWIENVLRASNELGKDEGLFDKAIAFKKAGNNAGIAQLEEKILDVSVAIKLVLRTFELA